MAASTTILANKLHEYPQQDVIDEGSASILDDCLDKNGGVLQLLHRYAGRTFCTPANAFASMRGLTIRTTWTVRGLMNFGCAAPFQS